MLKDTKVYISTLLKIKWLDILTQNQYDVTSYSTQNQYYTNIAFFISFSPNKVIVTTAILRFESNIKVYFFDIFWKNIIHEVVFYTYFLGFKSIQIFCWRGRATSTMGFAGDSRDLMLEIHILMQLLDRHGAWAHDYYRENCHTLYGWWGNTD